MILQTKKAGMSISIILLVFATIALCITALFVFNVRSPHSPVVLSDIEAMDDFRSAEDVFDFYIGEIVLDISKKNPSLTGDGFVAEFQNNYFAYEASPSVPIDFYSPSVKLQVKNNSRYDVSINGKNLNFRLEDFKFNKAYASDKTGGVTKMSSIRNISVSLRLS